MSTRDPGLTEKTTGLADYYQEGDYVVPQYTELGHKIKGGRMYGDKDEVIRKAQSIVNNAMMRGAELMPVPAKVTKTAQPKPPQKASKSKPTPAPVLKVDSIGYDSMPVAPTPPEGYSQLANADDALPSLDIVFKNSFGKIKVTVIAAQVDERSICLIFKDESELRFEPEVGDKFTVIVGPDAYNVFYPGFLFTWIDNRKKIMVLGRDIGANNGN